MTKSAKTEEPKSKLSVLDFIWKWTSDTPNVSKEEVAYFRDHPEEIDEFSSPTRLHQLFLLIGMTLGVLGVALSKLLSHSGVLDELHVGVAAFITDIVFEVGVALIGASIVTFMLVLVMNRQQKNALKWRDEIRKRIAEDDT